MPNRYVCNVLEELRTGLSRRFFRKEHCLSLVDEIQTMVNRMEESLYDKRDIRYKQKELREQRKTLIKLARKRRAKIEELVDEQ